jgi:hypothetical protein
MSSIQAEGFAPITLRLLVCTVSVLALGALFGQQLVQVLLPFLKVVLRWLADDFEILSLAIAKDGAETVLEARAVLDRAIVLNHQVVFPDGRTGFAVTTGLGSALQAILVACIATLTWPGSWRELLIRILLLPALTVPVIAMDAPAFLAGSLWDIQVRAFAPGDSSPLIWWMALLGNGGRAALGLAAGTCAVAISLVIVRTLCRTRQFN